MARRLLSKHRVIMHLGGAGRCKEMQEMRGDAGRCREMHLRELRPSHSEEDHTRERRKGQRPRELHLRRRKVMRRAVEDCPTRRRGWTVWQAWAWGREAVAFDCVRVGDSGGHLVLVTCLPRVADG